MNVPAAGTSFRDLAAAQGCVRPFDTLVRMSSESRHLIAETLGCRLYGVGHADVEAWCIINQNMRGLQARTHSIVEQLTPFSRNNSWWEIVTRTAQRCGVQFYPGMKDEEVERLLFDRLADLFVQHHVDQEKFAVDSIAKATPELDLAIASLSLSPNGMRTVLSAIALGTVRADESIRDGLARMRHWLRTGVRWSWRVSICMGLRLVQQQLTGIFGIWTSRGFWNRSRGNWSRVCAAVAAIYLQDLVDRTLDELETAGA